MRLRMPVAASDVACPFCDGIADKFGDHSRSCPCGGDRTKRHNRLRSVLAARADAAGLSPEVEKPNLLPPRLDHEGAAEDGAAPGRGRRPADVWLPSWGLHGPAAFDFAVTSGMRPGMLQTVVDSGARPAADYEVRKRDHLQTASLCTAEGLQFVPFVAEACGGGWAIGPNSPRDLAGPQQGSGAAKWGPGNGKLLQTLAVMLQRECARIELRRLPAEAGFHRATKDSESLVRNCLCSPKLFVGRTDGANGAARLLRSLNLYSCDGVWVKGVLFGMRLLWRERATRGGRLLARACDQKVPLLPMSNV